MVVKVSAAPFVPEERKLPVLAEAVQECKGCDLYRNATQAVFGDLAGADG
jgi:uracil-DNA glycosylase